MATLNFFYNRDFNSNANNFITWSNSVVRIVGMQIPGELSLNYVNFPINVRWTNSTVTLTLSVSIGIYSLGAAGQTATSGSGAGLKYRSLFLENSLFYTRTITCNSSNATAKTFWVAASSKSKTQILSRGAWYIGILPILSGETATSQMQINLFGNATTFFPNGDYFPNYNREDGYYGGGANSSSNSLLDIQYSHSFIDNYMTQWPQNSSPIPILITS